MTDRTRGIEPGGVGASLDAPDQVEVSGGSSMRSPRGLLGAIVLLLALPVAVFAQVLFGSGSELAIHFALAVGSVLVSFSAFDFETPRWVAWIGGTSAGGLAVIFLAQGVTQLIQSDSLTYITYQVLGDWPERSLLSLFVLWLVALLLIASRGRTRILGSVVMAIVVCVEVYGYWSLLYIGTVAISETPGLKLLYLLPLVWLLLESGKKRPEMGS